MRNPVTAHGGWHAARRRARTKSAFATLLLCLVLTIPAIVRAATEYTLADGLSQNSVLSMVRDEDGFLWLGTEDGLNRFDGYEFRAYRPDNEHALAAGANYIRALRAAGRHLFLASNGGGLSIFDRQQERFRLLGVADGLPAEHLTALAMVGQQTLYVASRNGLARAQWQGDPMQADFQVTPIPFGDNARHKDVWYLHAGASGLWIATGDGVFRADAQGRIEPFPISGAEGPLNTDALLEFPAGVLWVGTWSQGLFRIDLGSGATRQFLPGSPDAPGLRTHRVHALKPGPGGLVFVGTDRGLNWFDPVCDCIKLLEHRRSARIDGRGFILLALEVDERGGVFAGYWGEGLVRFTPHDRVFHVERHRDEGPPSLSHDRVRALMEDRSGNLWIGNVGGVQRVAASHRVAGTAWRFDALPPPTQAPEAARMVWHLLQDRSGRIWAATDDGLYWTDPEHVDWQRELPFGQDVPMPGVRHLIEDSQARLWVASSGGLGRIDAPGQPRRRMPIASESGEPWFRRQDESVHGLYQDPEQRIWIGTTGGLHIMDDSGRLLARYRASDGLPGPIVWSIYRHVDGSVWLATSGGLARVATQGNTVDALEFENITRRAGLPQGGVFGIVGDRDGNLWLTGNRGLIRFNPSTLEHRIWNQSEGLASDEFTINATAVGSDGWLYLGGIDGITAFDPGKLREQLEPPTPTLTRISMDNTPLQLGGVAGQAASLSLRHDHAPVILDYAGLVFDAPGTSRYSYRLDPAAPFTELGARRSLILDRLPHGRHALELAVDNRGRREARQLLAIEVVPPISATWPFRIGLALAIAVALVLIYLWRVRQLTRQRRQLELQVGSRTRELRAQKEALEATAQALVVANDKLKSLSLIDPLTGLPNRRALIEQTEAALRDASPDSQPVLALIDLDHFKRINDEYGHLAGDDVLRDFARMLGAQARPSVSVGRWGGEEFVVLFTPAQLEAVRQWSDSLMAQIRTRLVRHGQVRISYRISIGVAQAIAGDSMNSVLGRADRALYDAKADGRDQLKVAGTQCD
jgi:diguanylate cyclase (GGDEF)-like protein